MNDELNGMVFNVPRWRPGLTCQVDRSVLRCFLRELRVLRGEKRWPAQNGGGNHEEREDHEGKAEKAAIASVRLEVSVNICVHLRMVLG